MISGDNINNNIQGEGEYSNLPTVERNNMSNMEVKNEANMNNSLDVSGSNMPNDNPVVHPVVVANPNHNNNNSNDLRKSEEMDEPEQFRKVFIGGLNFRTDDNTLRSHFEKYGSLVDCVVMKDSHTKRSRGFGFVTYSRSTMVDALMKSRPHIIDGREVEPKRAMPREESGRPEVQMTVKKLFIGGIKEGISEEDLRQYFNQYGEILDCVLMTDKETRKPRGFGFVTYSDYDPVDKIILEKHHRIKSIDLDVKKAIPKDMPYNRFRKMAAPGQNGRHNERSFGGNMPPYGGGMQGRNNNMGRNYPMNEGHYASYDNQMPSGGPPPYGYDSYNQGQARSANSFNESTGGYRGGNFHCDYQNNNNAMGGGGGGSGSGGVGGGRNSNYSGYHRNNYRYDSYNNAYDYTYSGGSGNGSNGASGASTGGSGGGGAFRNNSYTSRMTPYNSQYGGGENGGSSNMSSTNYPIRQ
ncbi:hypothetical protein SNEBB_002363 [Seison nebaliae]|nr:hypothetical protein SNEBB_002363 [Seison nebaliae]